MQHTTQDSPAAAYAGPDRRESDRRAAASATEFARGQKFGRLEAAEEIARLTAELEAARAALQPFVKRNCSDAAITITVLTADVTAARAALASVKQGGEE